jgi:Glycosyl transferases group 1
MAHTPDADIAASVDPRVLLIPAHPGIQYHFARVGLPTYFLGHWDQFAYWRPRSPNVHDLLPSFEPSHLEFGPADYAGLLRDGTHFHFPRDFEAAWLHFPWQLRLLAGERGLPKAYCAAKADELSGDEWCRLLDREDFGVAAFYASTAEHLRGISGRDVPYVPIGLDPDVYAAPRERRPFILTVIHSWARRGWHYEVCRSATEGLTAVHVDHLDPAKPTLTYDRLLELFRSAQVYLHDGEQEYTIALIEALMSGLPVVTLDLPCIGRYVRHGVNGLVARTGKELREHCSLLLADCDLAASMGEQSRRLALAEFDERRWRRDWRALIQDMAACPR